MVSNPNNTPYFEIIQGIYKDSILLGEYLGPPLVMLPPTEGLMCILSNMDKEASTTQAQSSTTPLSHGF